MSSKDVARSVSAADELARARQDAIRAYQMRQSGMSWFRIAEEVGLTEPQTRRAVADIISSASEVVDAGMRSHFLSMEVGRLDALQHAIWPLAMSGDLQAVDRAVRIIAERSKLLGLHDTSTAPVTNNTIVVQGGTDEYVAALRAASRRALEASDGDDQ